MSKILMPASEALLGTNAAILFLVKFSTQTGISRGWASYWPTESSEKAARLVSKLYGQ